MAQICSVCGHYVCTCEKPKKVPTLSCNVCKPKDDCLSCEETKSRIEGLQIQINNLKKREANDHQDTDEIKDEIKELEDEVKELEDKIKELEDCCRTDLNEIVEKKLEEKAEKAIEDLCEEVGDLCTISDDTKGKFIEEYATNIAKTSCSTQVDLHFDTCEDMDAYNGTEACPLVDGMKATVGPNEDGCFDIYIGKWVTSPINQLPDDCGSIINVGDGMAKYFQWKSHYECHKPENAFQTTVGTDTFPEVTVAMTAGVQHINRPGSLTVQEDGVYLVGMGLEVDYTGSAGSFSTTAGCKLTINGDPVGLVYSSNDHDVNPGTVSDHAITGTQFIKVHKGDELGMRVTLDARGAVSSYILLGYDTAPGRPGLVPEPYINILKISELEG